MTKPLINSFFEIKTRLNALDKQRLTKEDKQVDDQNEQILKLVKKLQGTVQQTAFMTPFPVSSTLIKAIKEFTRKIESGEKQVILIKGKALKEKQLIFGQSPIVSLLCDEVQEWISSEYEEGTLGEKILVNANLWPFRIGLMDDKVSLANKVEKGLQSLKTQENNFFDNSYLESIIDNKTIKVTGNTLRFLFEVLTVIYQCIPEKKKIEWCDNCFRRKAVGEKYCIFHQSKNDTEYKRSRRVINSQGKEKPLFQWYRVQRNLLGNKPRFFNENISDYSDLTQINGLIISTEANQIVSDTMVDTGWHNVEKYWLEYVRSLPNVLRLMESYEYTQANNWTEFVSIIYASLGESIEQSTHPIWVISILENAEEWFFLDKKYGDKRETNIKDMIICLSEEGMVQSEIKNKLNISRQRVSKVLIEYKKLKN